jgi:cell division control protein 45
MLYGRDDVAQLYQRIRECSAASPAAVTVLILVSLEADGVVTCAMLTKLLEQDEIPHKVKPIKDYGALGEVFENDIVDDAELRNIVLLQCGAIVDLFDMLGGRLAEMDAERAGGPRSFDETPHPECRFWILDSHRPVAVENATCGERLCVLHDDEPNEDLDALAEQEHILNDPDFQDEEDEDEEDGRPTQRRRLDPSAYAQLSPDSRASQFHAVRRLQVQYYASSWRAAASAVLMYRLVTDLNRTSNGMLWLAAVGLTDQLVHERVEYHKYVFEAQQLQEEVASLNQSGDAETREVHDADSGVTVNVAQHIGSSMRLESVQELRLSLLRHWSLLEAMENSAYVATRLGLWNQRGRENLRSWLCRMGFPLAQCRQLYEYMKPEIREGLHEKMVLFGSEYGLMNLTYPSLRRVTSYELGATVSAADMVFAIDAQLEASSGASGQTDQPEEEVRSAINDSFSNALRMLTSSSAKAREEVQQRGIERSKELMRAMISTGHSVLATRNFEQLGDFTQVILRESVETEKFTQEQSLTKLALFLADALRETRKNSKEAIPVLIAAPKKDRTHLVVAVLGSARFWGPSGGRNAFGKAFLEAARDPRVKARVAHESFESTVCRVASDDLRNFLEGVALNYDVA